MIKKENVYKKILNWVVPIAIIFIIMTSETYEFFYGFFLAIAYVVYRLIDDKGKIFAYRAKNNYKRGNLSRTICLYEKSCKTKKIGFKEYVSYAYSLILKGRYEKADQVLRSIKSEGGVDVIKTQMVICESIILAKTKSVIQGIIMLERLDEDRKTTAYYANLGKLYLLQGNMEKAKSFNEKAYNYNKESVLILENLLITYYLTKDYENCNKIVEQMIKEKPFSKEAFKFAKLTYEKAGNTKKANQMRKKETKFEESIFVNN